MSADHLHAGDALSALLDGGLSSVEADTMREHVTACDACGRELEDVRVARRLVRALPAVEPPSGFLTSLLDDADVVVRLRPRRVVLAAVSGSVAAGLLLLVLAATSLSLSAVRPEVTTSIERHASTVGALEAAGQIARLGDRFVSPSSVPPTTAQARSADDLPAPYHAPETVAGYRLVEAYAMTDGVHLLYRRGPYALSIFETRGDLDWDALPEDGTRLHVGTHNAWRWDGGGADGRLYVVDCDGMVVVFIGDEPGDAVLDVVAAMPEARSLSMRSRVQRSVAKALELFSPAP